MTTSTDTLRAEFGTSHCQGRRERQQDALLATAELIAVADGFGDRDDLVAAALGRSQKAASKALSLRSRPGSVRLCRTNPLPERRSA